MKFIKEILDFVNLLLKFNPMKYVTFNLRVHASGNQRF